MGPDGRLLGVLSLAPIVDEEQREETQCPADDDCDLGRAILGRRRGDEDLGADDVADTVCDLFHPGLSVTRSAWAIRRTNTYQIHGSDGRFARVARDVGRDQRQQRHKRHRRRLGEVVADEAANGVVVIEARDEEHAENAEQQTDGRDELG